jgi:hypothetical protein
MKKADYMFAFDEADGNWKSDHEQADRNHRRRGAYRRDWRRCVR